MSILFCGDGKLASGEVIAVFFKKKRKVLLCVLPTHSLLKHAHLVCIVSTFRFDRNF